MGSKRRSSDIISLLVSIYGSKDIFINEYRDVLADRLLHQHNYNTARSAFSSPQKVEGQGRPFTGDPLLCVFREIRNVELLKLRFGESHMHYCEVMLKVRKAWPRPESSPCCPAQTSWCVLL